MARVLAGRAREISGTELPEEFADYRRIELQDAPLDGMGAQLVVGPHGAHILLSDKLTDPAERRWSIAHELGHYELKHPAQPAAELCLPRPRLSPRQDRDDEDEADEWALTYTMPDSDVALVCDRKPMTLDTVAELAHRCGVPLAAAAIRVTGVTIRLCAAVLSRQGVIQWVSPSVLFLSWTHHAMLREGDVIGPGALARQFFDNGRMCATPELVPADAWLRGVAEGSWIHEHSMETGERGTILTMLWMSGESRWRVPRDSRAVPRIMPAMRDALLSDERFLAHLAESSFPPDPCPFAPTWLDTMLRLHQPAINECRQIVNNARRGAVYLVGDSRDAVVEAATPEDQEPHTAGAHERSWSAGSQYSP